jgi:hypothetical protein
MKISERRFQPSLTKPVPQCAISWQPACHSLRFPCAFLESSKDHFEFTTPWKLLWLLLFGDKSHLWLLKDVQVEAVPSLNCCSIAASAPFRSTTGSCVPTPAQRRRISAAGTVLGRDNLALDVYNWGSKLKAGKLSERGATRVPRGAMHTLPSPQSVQKCSETRKPPPPNPASRSCSPGASPGSAARGFRP